MSTNSVQSITKTVRADAAVLRPSNHPRTGDIIVASMIKPWRVGDPLPSEQATMATRAANGSVSRGARFRAQEKQRCPFKCGGLIDIRPYSEVTVEPANPQDTLFVGTRLKLSSRINAEKSL